MKRRLFCGALILPAFSSTCSRIDALTDGNNSWPIAAFQPDVDAFEMQVGSAWVKQIREQVGSCLSAVRQLRCRLLSDPWQQVMPLLRIRDCQELPREGLRFLVFGTEVWRLNARIDDRLDPADDLNFWDPLLKPIAAVVAHYFRAHVMQPAFDERPKLFLSSSQVLHN